MRCRGRLAALMLLSSALLIVTPSSGATGAEPRPALPLDVADERIRPLRELVDRTLQTRLEERLREQPLWAGLIARRKMAVGIVDLADPLAVRFARVNGDAMLYAASLPKLAILLAAAQSLEDGSLEESPQALRDMRLMIAVSDNRASTRLYDRIGFDKIRQVLTDPRYALYDRERRGGLWVGKRYGATGPRYPDPIAGVTHGATVSQICRFYYLLAMGKLVTRERSRQMLDMLEDPEIHHKFVGVLESAVPDATLYRKSGTWRQWHSDSVLVWGPVWRRYIAAGLIEHPDGSTILEELLPVVEEILRSDT